MEMRIMKKKVLVVLSLSFLMHTLLNDKEEWWQGQVEGNSCSITIDIRTC
jgi:hypothetical protein